MSPAGGPPGRAGHPRGEAVQEQGGTPETAVRTWLPVQDGEPGLGGGPSLQMVFACGGLGAR
jgi:hypothetical protein